MTIPKIASPIVIDGRPDEDAWRQAAVFKDFYQTEPGYNTTPSKPTEVYVVYDEKNLYIAFKCWDEKDKIRTVDSRDDINGDGVQVWLDTFDDHRRAYVLSFNPFGTQQDGIFTEGQGEDDSLDIVMESKGVIEDWGWSVEVRIPFKSLRYSAGQEKMWGFNVMRAIERFNGEVDRWMPDDRDVSGTLIKHGKITGLDDIKFEHTIEVVPSITVAKTGQRKSTITAAGFGPFGPFDPIFNPIGLKDPGRFVPDPMKKDIGVNLKYTLSPNITLDAAINPDYADIEADEPVVAVNQRFPIYFQEKRPFFLEGNDIFATSMQPFYSRTIIDPDFALKLTGKVGKNTFGILAASDNAPGNYSVDERADILACQRERSLNSSLAGTPCDGEDFLDKNASFGIVRLSATSEWTAALVFLARPGFFLKIAILSAALTVKSG